MNMPAELVLIAFPVRLSKGHQQDKITNITCKYTFTIFINHIEVLYLIDTEVVCSLMKRV